MECNVCRQDHSNPNRTWCDRSDLEIENDKLIELLEIISELDRKDLKSGTINLKLYAKMAQELLARLSKQST